MTIIPIKQKGKKKHAKFNYMFSVIFYFSLNNDFKLPAYVYNSTFKILNKGFFFKKKLNSPKSDFRETPGNEWQPFCSHT